MITMAIWLTAAHEVNNLSPGIMHMLYWMGWLLFDLAYFVTSLQIAACRIVFMRDKREKKLVPSAVSWWGWVTFASFFAVSAIPFVTTGPLAFNGVISFWIAFFTWFFWIPSLSYFVIKAIDRVQAEEAAGSACRRLTGWRSRHCPIAKPRRLPGVDGIWVFIGADAVIFAILFLELHAGPAPQTRRCSRPPGTRST